MASFCSTMASETTAAQTGAVGKLRRDPFAMLPFCGYNMADYFGHWLKIGKRSTDAQLPRMYYVNWFRKGGEGRLLWPGFGENSRVLKWIFQRCEGEGDVVETPIGLVPAALDTEGLNVDITSLLNVNRDEWLAEVDSIAEYYASFGDRLPAVLEAQLDALRRGLR